MEEKFFEITMPFGKLIVDADIYYRIVKDKSSVPRPYHKFKSLKGMAFLYKLVNCRMGSDKKYTLARLLMQPKRNEVVDHINRNPLDSRRSNLRVVSPRQNSLNKIPKSSTGYIGVSITMLRGAKRLRATFQTASKRMNFSLYDLPENRIICALAHDKFVIDAGDEEYAPLNFPIFKNEPFRSKLSEIDINEFRKNNAESVFKMLGMENSKTRVENNIA